MWNLVRMLQLYFWCDTKIKINLHLLRAEDILTWHSRELTGVRHNADQASVLFKHPSKLWWSISRRNSATVDLEDLRVI